MRLLSFSVRNYRSFYEEQKISFNEDDKNVTAIFGPNGSGKSNLFKAMVFYRNFILYSTRFHEGKVLGGEQFLLNETGRKEPTVFSAEFKNDKYAFSYQFSVYGGQVEDEKLQRKELGGGALYKTIFSRKSIPKDRFKEFKFTRVLLRETRDDALVLTRAFETNNKIAEEIFGWLKSFQLLAGQQPINITADKVIENQEVKEKVLSYLKRADLYIQDISVERASISGEDFKNSPFRDEVVKEMQQSGHKYKITTVHAVRNLEGRVVAAMPFSMGPGGQESTGTNRMFELAFPLIDTIEKGRVLYIDEFEVNLHPKECLFIVSLFNSLKGNKGKAQLIINTHSKFLMNYIGKNNIYLLGKNHQEATVIGEMKGVRSTEASFEKKYDAGFFGSLPNIGWD